MQGNVYNENNEYVQSANTLFHFMNRLDYLVNAIERKALVPRYCKEDISYLDINVDGIETNEVAILQKCFCDMPFHSLSNSYSVNINMEDLMGLSTEEEREACSYDSHPSFYGKYAIAFSKKWGEQKKLQPVYYINTNSETLDSRKAFLKYAFSLEDLPTEIYERVVSDISFIKPLRGKMSRRLSSGKEIHFDKNFHDEKEWRYVPESEILNNKKLDKIMVNPSLVGEYVQVNEQLESNDYEEIWLKFEYEDIKYIIVSNKNDRLELINYICEMSEDKFEKKYPVKEQKLLLISKILVLDEIRGDW